MAVFAAQRESAMAYQCLVDNRAFSLWHFFPQPGLGILVLSGLSSICQGLRIDHPGCFKSIPQVKPGFG